jgi:hypothetical protein
VAYTTTEFLEGVKDRCNFPSGSTVTDAKLLGWADQECKSRLLPEIISKRENYLVADYTTTITSGVSSYRIPPRAFGQKLVDVVITAADGRERSLAWLEDDDVSRFTLTTGNPSHFKVENNSVILFPTPNTSVETLSLKHNRRPSALVATSAAGMVSTVAAGVVTFATSRPSTFGVTQTPNFQKYDLVLGTPGHECLAIDISVSAVGASTVTIPTASAALLTYGDYICLAEQTPVPQVPPDIVPVLEQMTAVRYLESKGDLDMLMAANNRLRELVNYAGITLSPRVERESRKITGGAFTGAKRGSRMVP